MIQIPPAPTPLAGPLQPADPAIDAAAPQAAPADAALLPAHGNLDPAAKFDALFGRPPVVLYSDKGGHGGGNATRAAKSDPLVGVTLPGQKDVAIQRSIGDARGYESKNHAIAWARAAGSDRAMVVQDGKGRWHAVETSKVGTQANAATGAIRSAIPVGKVDPTTYARMKSEAEAAEAKGDLSKWKAFAAYATGVPESEIDVIGKGGTPKPNRVNVNLSPDFNAEGRAASFRDPPWVQLGRAAFDRPANAVATLAHEEVHAGHRRLAIEWYTKYEAAPHGNKTFRQWMNAQTSGKGFEGVRLAELVAGVQDGTYATTELEAHIEAARLAFASGDLTQARTDLRKVATLPVLPAQLQTKEISIAVLKELRASLTGDALAAFDETVKAAGANSILKDRALR
jgi:hypothetical protein